MAKIREEVTKVDIVPSDIIFWKVYSDKEGRRREVGITVDKADKNFLIMMDASAFMSRLLQFLDENRVFCEKFKDALKQSRIVE